MRASRQTELAAAHPLHVVCDWIGNSASIASKHYLQVREADFEQATKRAAECAAHFGKDGQEQQTALVDAQSRETKKAQENRAKRDSVRQAAKSCDKSQYPLGESNDSPEPADLSVF